ncbi:MAG: NADPH:quinone oxidoreductase family protein [Kiloniellaceae bacterium]
MRAVLCREWGGPEVLRVAEVEPPAPGPGELRLAVHAAGVNFADLLMVAGRYQEKPPFPFSPGLEAAGTVEAVGPGVARVKPGERVLALTDRGAYAEGALVRETDVFPIPEAMDFVTAAGFAITYGTAHGALTWRAGLQAGEVLLVHGAAGGAGLAAVEVGKALGATVIATARGADRLAIARAHGADHLIDTAGEDLRTRVKELTGGRGADVVFDPVGGDVFDASLRCVAWGARLLVIGFAAGRAAQIPANILLVKNVSALGFYWGSYRRRAPQLVRAEFAELFDWYAQGKLTPHVSHALDLARAAEALTLLKERKSTGKVVLTTGRSRA